ncbi:EpsG family protein [Empedobacter tilapiae]|uniref:EpsG family protein n=1 Tax=Empedobacter tilapiae TaxID=2491114 RepID=A0A4Z1BW68_9FLAO|nr:EpsG family protein [Empedobacter tilapiae]TGN26695.1 EpsG family protein [Empedobacter tilapiae]
MQSIIDAFNTKFTLIYLGLSFITFVLICEYIIKNKSSNKIQNVFLILFAFIFIILIGTRDKIVGADSERTLIFFTGARVIKSLSELKDIGIYIVSMLARSISDNYKTFFTFNAILYIIPIIIGIFNLTKKNRLVFFFIIVSMFFFKTMGINTTRQGIAFSFFFLALTMFSKKKWLSILFFIVAFFNHASIIIPIAFYLLSTKIKNVNLVIGIYIIATVLSLLNFNLNSFLGKIPIINILVEERMDLYYKQEYQLVYQTGFRINFFTFNTIFAIIGYITLNNLKKKIEHYDEYKRYYVCFMLASSFFFLMFSAAFSDRFGFLSWIFIPFLLLPYTQTNKKIGYLNMFGIFFICIALFLIFNLK